MGVDLELVFAAVREQIKSQTDALVCAVHGLLIDAGLRCAGLQVQQTTSAADASQLLPPGWNAQQDVYELSYVDSQQSFFLKVLKIESTGILLNIARVCDNTVATLSLDPSNYVTENLRDYSSTYKNLAGLKQQFTAEILPILQPQKQLPRQERPNQQPRPPRNPASQGIPFFAPRPGAVPGSVDPFGVGRGDLDPLGRGGGGMLMDPRQAFRPQQPDPNARLPGALPPGAVPPGARFDPFRPPMPPDGGQRPGPNPDHLRPPDGDDDQPN